MTTPPRKIMIAMDGSKHADYAFEWYLKYFYKERDDILIVCCTEPSRMAVPPTLRDDETETAFLVEQLQKKIQNAGVKGNVLRLSGSKPGDAIVKASKENKSDLIITGTRGLGIIRKTLMGSVSQYIVHHAHIPVLVVRQ